MIKECPTCGRTYSDTTISFCLADGALLSAPFDRPESGDKRDERSAADTAVMPAPPEPKPTQASPLPTITAPASPVRPTAAKESSQSARRPLVLALAGVVAIALAIVIGYFVLFAGRNRTQGELATALPSPTPAAQSSAMPTASPGQTPGPTTKPTSTPTPASKSEATPSPIPAQSATPLPATLDQDPALFPPKEEQRDYNKVFSVREVDQPARILSRPAPSYTEEARKNQVQGTVTLRVVLAASGSVTNISVVRGLPDGLSERAIEAARRIKFTPAQKDGHAVSQYATVEMNFSVY